MKISTTTLALVGSLLATASVAQTAATPTRPVPPSANADVTPNRAPGTGVVERNTGPAAASGDRNQAVATTNANAPQPAKGANSFTEGEARRRMESSGYAEVTGLQKDANGIWHGTAKKGGNTVKVWLDYKGNVGAS
jgi:protein CpxP